MSVQSTAHQSSPAQKQTNVVGPRVSFITLTGSSWPPRCWRNTPVHLFAIVLAQKELCAGPQRPSLVVGWLKYRTYSVDIRNYSSSYSPIVYGVPQGSILGPVLFSFFMLPLYAIKTNIYIYFFFCCLQLKHQTYEICNFGLLEKYVFF